MKTMNLIKKLLIHCYSSIIQSHSDTLLEPIETDILKKKDRAVEARDYKRKELVLFVPSFPIKRTLKILKQIHLILHRKSTVKTFANQHDEKSANACNSENNNMGFAQYSNKR
ncbi:hypothetical protein ACFO25_07360 [Paenactinomyces guangxiensis]|uniref:Uncharacterized protein n=1 Tax=Paenactinomyces guangxiensis TaxID=1490290 RepID=A0A7W1WNH2_9BACL|nr:hypothetical protein [Paenactinomyces guangxiensis]MBA4493134.1 hypothetical protein [Paenactinomyces guangxiensis]MBH8590016.1 hypothetical protein [Paenactinomyces guangxiensis]